MNQTMILVLSAFSAGVLLESTGCATAPIPSERVEASTAAIRSAEEMGADKIPQAGLYLQLAREESTRAKALIAEGQAEEAGTVLLRSTADAELALALAKDDHMRAEAQKALEKVKTIQQENQ